MSSYITRKANKRRDLLNTLSPNQTVCPTCRRHYNDIPPDIWDYSLRKHAQLTEKHEEQLFERDTVKPVGQQLVDQLMRLDRVDDLVAANISAQKAKYHHLWSEMPPTSDGAPPE